MIKSRWLRGVLYAILIFLAGIVTGTLLAPWLGRTFMRPPQPRELAYHMLDRLQGGLHLTDEQTAKIKPIIEATGADMETIRRETAARVHQRISQTNEQISALLTPEQKVQFIKMEEEHRRRMQEYHREHHHHFGPAPDEPPPPPPPN
jgi:Spy/CpxP family protein refolding chaperone